MSLTKRPDKHHSYDDVSPKLSIQKSFLLLLYAIILRQLLQILAAENDYQKN